MVATESGKPSNFLMSIVTIVSWGTRLIGIGLILLAIQCFVFPGVAKGYGVFPVDQNGFAYLLATGMRDLALGLMTFFHLQRYRSSLATFLLILSIVPLADTLIVLRYGNSIAGIAPHAIGLFGILAIAYFANEEQRLVTLASSQSNNRP